MSINQSTRDASLKAGAFATALRKGARAVAAVAQRYGAIARTAFHADDSTLRHLHMYPFVLGDHDAIFMRQFTLLR